MADEPQVPAQPEGAGQPTKKKPTPINLAMVEAAERGIDLTPAPVPKPPEPKTTEIAPEPAALSEPPTVSEAEAVPDPASPSTPVEQPRGNRDRGERGERSDRGDRGDRRDRRGPREPEAAAAEPDTGAPSTATLEELAEAATTKRLSPRDEDRATALLRENIIKGETAPALAAMPKLPWILGVRAIEHAWPQLTPEGRAQLLADLAALNTEYAIRLRLSVARSLAKIDPPVGVELAGAVCGNMWDTEKGALSSDHSKLIGNVFIGRGKPWVIQLPLEGLPPADAQAIVSAVVFSAFNVNNPPITQLSILRYAGERLGELHPNLLGMVGKGVSRWSGKWQDSLRKEVPNLPEAISTTLKAGRPGKPEREARPDEPADAAPNGDEEEGEIPLPPELEEKLKLAVESGDAEAVAAVTLEANAWRDAHASAHQEASEARQSREEPSEESDRRGDKRRRGRDRERERNDRNDRPADRRERPAYVSREQEAAAKGGAPFNLSNVLKQIESQFTQLRNELGATQAKLRKAETGPARRPADRVVLSVEESNLSPEELKRLVLQLERRSTELQARVEELLADSETRALATASDNDVTAQFRTLLRLKLQEDYSDYLALEKNLPEFVVQQHYRAVIRHVFGVLREEGVTLEGDLPPPPPEPLPPPPPPPVIEDEDDEDDSAIDELDREPDAEPAEVEHAEEAPEQPATAEDSAEESAENEPLPEERDSGR